MGKLVLSISASNLICFYQISFHSLFKEAWIDTTVATGFSCQIPSAATHLPGIEQ